MSIVRNLLSDVGGETCNKLTGSTPIAFLPMSQTRTNDEGLLTSSMMWFNNIGIGILL